MNDFNELMRSCLGNSKVVTFKPYAAVAGKTITPDRHTEKVNLKKRLVHLTFEYETLFKEDFFIALNDGEMTAERSIRNLRVKPEELILLQSSNLVIIKIDNPDGDTGFCFRLFEPVTNIVHGKQIPSSMEANGISIWLAPPEFRK